MSAVITGVGALSPLGLDLESFWNSVLEEKDCIQDGIGAFSAEQWRQIESRVPSPVGKVAQLSWVAAKEAMSKAGWSGLTEEDGVILGTTTGQVGHWESLLMEAFKSGHYESFLSEGGISTPGRSLSEFCQLFNFRGKSIMVVSACSASTQALGLAAEWVRTGRVKRCLVGGAEVLTTLSVEGFRCLGLLSPERSKPFDASRSGINLSEAAAFYCVEKASANAVARISSFATNSDAYHLTAPHPEGQGTEAIFHESLRLANLNADDIDWVHAHGTASPTNDKAEGTAIQKVFPKTPVTSTKAYHGHSLGASGALELSLCVQALRQQLRVKSLGCENLDPSLKLLIQKEHEKGDLRHIMKSSLGFGGVNATLILSHPSVLREGDKS